MATSEVSVRGDLEWGTIPRMIEANAAEFADHAAIADPEYPLTYAQLCDAMRSAARAIIAAGVEAGDRIAIWAPNIAEWVVAAVGAQAAGAVLVPLNTRFKGTEAAYVINRSRARLLFTVTDFLDTNYVELLEVASEETPVEATIVLRGEVPEGCVGWQEFLGSGADIDEATVDAAIAARGVDDLSDILFTSGTTGAPKGVMTTHGQSLRAYRDWSELTGLRSDDEYLVINPFFHGFGYKAGWLAGLMMGATVHPHAVFDVAAIMERVAAQRITVLPGPPTIYHSILDHPDFPSFDLSSLRLSVTGAAAIPVELIHRMGDELTFETIITGYGLTESSAIASMCRFDDDPETIATTSGRAIPGVEIRIVDDDLVEVPRGEPGEIVVRGYNVMQGYFEDPEETRLAITDDGWLHTGDIGVMDARGYIDITDRKKDMYIVGGFNAYPAEIENLLLANDELSQVAIVGVPDERMGEVGVAFVVPRSGSTVDPVALIAWSREHMANYKVPRRVEVVDELPMNASGKVLKRELRERAAE
jgi:acyl-CoA synthetase (AMP-forming)/AMP-acid ligase II